jgi:hypothetical protein
VLLGLYLPFLVTYSITSHTEARILRIGLQGIGPSSPKCAWKGYSAKSDFRFTKF